MRLFTGIKEGYKQGYNESIERLIKNQMGLKIDERKEMYRKSITLKQSGKNTELSIKIAEDPSY